MLGQQGAMNMQILVRGWLVYEITGSYAALGVMGLATGGPMLVLSVVGGVLADRMPMIRIIQMGQLASMGSALVLAALLWMDMLQFWHLLIAALFQGTVLALMMPSRQALIPDIVGRELLMNAVSLNAAGMNLMRLGGPSLGGLLIAVIGPGWVYFTMALLYLGAMVTLFGLKPKQRPAAAVTDADAPAPVKRRRGTQGFSDIAEGAKYIRHDRTVSLLLAVSFTTSILAMPYMQMLPGFVSEVFGEGASKLGFLISASGIGAFLGAIAMASMPPKRRGVILLVTAIIIGVGLVVFSASNYYWVSLLVMVFIGVGTAGRQALGQVLIQTYSDDRYRGRVMSIHQTQVSAMMLGAFALGLIAEVVGVQVALGGMAIVLLVVTTGFLVLSPTVRNLD